MGQLSLPRLWSGQVVLLAGGVVMAFLLGGAAAMAPPGVVLTGIPALALVLAVAAHPPVAAYALLAGTPLLAGLDRGDVLPVLRPHEALAALVGLGLLLRLMAALSGKVEPGMRLRLDRIDAATVLLAVAGSLLPLLWMQVRGREITQDDLLFALQLWKYYAVFLIVRLSVREEPQVRICLWIAMVATSVVAGVAILQSLKLFGVADLLSVHYAPFDDVGAVQINRGTSTLASSFAVADVMVFSLAIAGGLLLRGTGHRTTIVVLSAVFFLGSFAAGQFSGVIGLVVGIFAFGVLTRRLTRSVLALAPLGIAALIALRPVIEGRLSGFNTASGLPPSWQARLENLQTYFWPELLSDSNWLTGVRPAARVFAPGGEGIWIESGFTWILWTGGVGLAIAFAVFLATVMPPLARVARERMDAVGAAAIASFTAVAVTAVLMVFDPHLTLRGSADLNFSLLALAMTGRIASKGARKPSRTRARL